MSPQQRFVFWILSLIGLVYFATFLVPNAYGARNEAILADASKDEYVTYPNVVRILTPGKTFNDERANLFLYEDYHYGYPFYALSALTLLPVRLIYGAQFTQHMQLNLLLLRQIISLLPMILAAGFLVFMQTRFESLWKSVSLFIFLLTIRGVVRNHIWWWHPDALAVLAVVLTIFFLNRDNLRLGRNFYLAAVFCGLAVAIKLLGLFFFVTIPIYLILAWISHREGLSRAVIAGVGFVVIMVVVTIGSNPFIFSKDQRARLVEIQTQKQFELSHGYPQDNPILDSKGPQWWASTLEKWYASPIFLAFLFFSTAAGCIWGTRTLSHRLILTWVVPYSIYLSYFVAVKPDHYWLPVMLPLFSTAFTGWDLLTRKGAIFIRPVFSRIFIWRKLAAVLIVLALVAQVATNLGRDASGNIAIYRSAVATGIQQVQTLK